MAREHANIRLDMWGDADWRALSMPAQWLYELLLTHPQTSRAGVSDWRPKRLAAMAQGITHLDVERMGAELASRFFVVIDEDTEEVLIRSYVKHDGVMKQPNMAVTMAKDWTGIASERLRRVVAFEVQKLRADQPDLQGWKSEKALNTLLSTEGINAKIDPSADPTSVGIDPTVEGHATTTGTSTTTSTPLLTKGGTLSAPSIFCSRHPQGTDLPCRGCKVAYAEYEKWVNADTGAPFEHTHRWLGDGTCVGCEEQQGGDF